MQKTICNLPSLVEIVQVVNRRYLKFISAIETPEAGVDKLHQLTETQQDDNHRYKGFNLFSEEDSFLFRLLLNGEFVFIGYAAHHDRPI